MGGRSYSRIAAESGRHDADRRRASGNQTNPAGKVTGLAFFNSIIHAIERLGARSPRPHRSQLLTLPRPNTRLCLLLPALHDTPSEPLLCSPRHRRRLFLFSTFSSLSASSSSSSSSSSSYSTIGVDCLSSQAPLSVLAFSPTDLFFVPLTLASNASLLHAVLNALPQTAFYPHSNRIL